MISFCCFWLFQEVISKITGDLGVTALTFDNNSSIFSVQVVITSVNVIIKMVYLK